VVATVAGMFPFCMTNYRPTRSNGRAPTKALTPSSDALHQSGVTLCKTGTARPGACWYGAQVDGCS